VNSQSNYIFISCGEASGDLYASRLAAEIIKINPNLAIKAIGGPLIQSTGATLIQHINELQLIGALEIIPKIFHVYYILHNVKKQLKEDPPLIAILIDFPDFNFMLGKFLKSINVPIVYYVSPQIWAWRYSRIYAMKKFVDVMIPLFKFEVAIYQNEGIKTFFAGHPLLDIAVPNFSKESFLSKYGINKDAFILGIMPGSRVSEIKNHTPVLLEVLKKIKEREHSLQFLLIKAPTVPHKLLEPYKQINTIILDKDKYEAMYYSNLLLIASGTATIEACIATTPMIVFYKLNQLSWTLGRWLVKTKFLSMVNICAGEEIVPEFYQKAFNIKNLLEASLKMINSPSLRNDQISKLEKVKKLLGDKCASQKIAKYIISNFLNHAS
jgi:lipid-A-disaccharide synthase